MIGAPKAGSTAVHAVLVGHPDLYLSTPKEPKYFLTADQPPRRADPRRAPPHDVAMLEDLLGRSIQDWLSDADRGTYAVRRS